MTSSQIMQGFPVLQANRVPSQDWDRAPWNRWSFQHVREILPTVEVWRGDGPVWHLPEQLQDIDRVSFTAQTGHRVNVGTWLEHSFTDGFIVLHHGKVVFERYMNNMTPRTLHLSQSVAKSITGTVAGILVGRGLLDPDARVTDYLPELEATAWSGARLRHVLDMTSGVRFIEVYEAHDSDIAMTDIASGWKTAPEGVHAPDCIWSQIMGLKHQLRPHGETFEYRSIETDVLAHCMERVTGTRLAELVSRELWAPMGAAESANFTVDSAGYALADAGFNATLRDYARFGQMLANGGTVHGHQIVPEAWIKDTLACDASLFNEPYTDILPQGAYRNQFWIRDHAGSVMMARGVFGQLIYIAPQEHLVIAKLSSWPEFVSIERSLDGFAAIDAISAALNGTHS